MDFSPAEQPKEDFVPDVPGQKAKRKKGEQSPPFSGKRIRQNIVKVRQIQKRDRRLRRIALTVMSFTQPMNWAAYEIGRREARAIEAKKKAKATK